VSAFIAGLLLAFPTFYFMLISILKFELNQPYLYDSVNGLMNQWGLKEDVGWNINLLILLGPVFAVLLNLAVILRIQFDDDKDQFDCRFTITKNWWNLAVVLFAAFILGFLALYLIGENCICGLQ
jgi:hypothetical protein